jgi:hypothetical protein
MKVGFPGVKVAFAGAKVSIARVKVPLADVKVSIADVEVSEVRLLDAAGAGRRAVLRRQIGLFAQKTNQSSPN